jgi:hypothetical protein
MLLFKREAVVRAPKAMALRAGWGTLRSASFLGVFNAIYQGNGIETLRRWMLTRAERVLLRSAELASGARGTETCPRVAAGCARIQGVVLARRLAGGPFGAHRGETSAWGTCYVCTSEGP